MEVECIGTGIPEPKVAWFLNGSLINSRGRQKAINASIDTKLANERNGTNVYRKTSTVVISSRTFPMSFQCFVENAVGKVYSDKVYALRLQGDYLLTS